MVKIGILNLQGAVSEHFDMTRKTVENLKLDIEVEEVRYSDDVEKCDGLIISGGESTVIGKLIKEIIFLSLELVLEWCFLAKKQISTSHYLNLWT